MMYNVKNMSGRRYVIIRKATIENIKQILKKNKQINFSDIKHVEIDKKGTIRFQIPASIKDRQIIVLLGYLKWFFQIKDEEIR